MLVNIFDIKQYCCTAHTQNTGDRGVIFTLLHLKPLLMKMNYAPVAQTIIRDSVYKAKRIRYKVLLRVIKARPTTFQ